MTARFLYRTFVFDFIALLVPARISHLSGGGHLHKKKNFIKVLPIALYCSALAQCDYKCACRAFLLICTFISVIKSKSVHSPDAADAAHSLSYRTLFLFDSPLSFLARVALLVYGRTLPMPPALLAHWFRACEMYLQKHALTNRNQQPVLLGLPFLCVLDASVEPPVNIH